MVVPITGNSPLAQALQNVVQPKLVEVGWGGVDDSTLAEYIILMLVNGKTQEQIASELSNDLLGLGPEDNGAIDFSQWLFEQVDVLNNELNGSATNEAAQSDQNGDQALQNGHEGESHEDTDMMDKTDAQAQNSIPTGPKAMRSNVRERRMLGQINKTLDRTGDSLRRVRGSPGTGRINTHAREAPKGPRAQQNFQMRGAAARNQMQNPMPNSMPGAAPMHPLMTMSPQQQMQLFAMYEEQARVMAQILSPQQQTTFAAQGMNGLPFNPVMPDPTLQQQQHQQSGKSLFERVQSQPRKSNFNRPDDRHTASSDQDKMMSDPSTNESSVPQDGMQKTEAADPSQTMCKYNLKCTKTDCLFAHQSPAAPDGTAVDVTDVCSFGAACKNRKCVGRHPSPAKRSVHQAVQECKFYPNCTNPNCPFKHPDMPPCRNGADCTVPGCKFAHSKIECRYNPCLNPSCPFKHAEGQKRGAFEDKVWVAEGEGNDHVSERKFVADESAAEELIIPNQQQGVTEAPAVPVEAAT